jgi:hypothetical protein
MIYMTITPPNHSLQRATAGHRSCNRRASWPSSLSLGRYDEAQFRDITISLSTKLRLLLQPVKCLRVVAENFLHGGVGNLTLVGALFKQLGEFVLHR